MSQCRFPPRMYIYQYLSLIFSINAIDWNILIYCNMLQISTARKKLLANGPHCRVSKKRRKKQKLVNGPYCRFGKKKFLMNWTELVEENLSVYSYINASMHQWSTRWRSGTIKSHAIQVETSVNPSAKWLHITISEMEVAHKCNWYVVSHSQTIFSFWGDRKKEKKKSGLATRD